MAHLRDPSQSGLRAITINGSIRVESEEELAQRRERRRKERKSRWGGRPAEDTAGQNGAPPAKKSSILLPEDWAAGRVNNPMGKTGAGVQDSPVFRSTVSEKRTTSATLKYGMNVEVPWGSNPYPRSLPNPLQLPL